MKKKINIAIFSSASIKIEKKNLLLARNIGKYLAKNKIKISTGGCVGIPDVIAESSFKNNGEVVAYYPDETFKELFLNKHVHNNDTKENYSERKFLKGFSNRSVKMIHDVDAAIVLNGRFGTLSEFTLAVEEGLPILVLEGTSGITDKIKRLAKLIYKEFPYNNVIFEKDYKKGIDKLLKIIKNKNS
jgi:uncharacterized protein (TIGR00725 family)